MNRRHQCSVILRDNTERAFKDIKTMDLIFASQLEKENREKHRGSGGSGDETARALQNTV